MNYRQYEEWFIKHAGSIIFFLLVALTSFVLGQQYHLVNNQNASSKTTTPVASTPSEDKVKEIQQTLATVVPTLASSPTASDSVASGQPDSQSDLININTATEPELEKLTGIGPTKAKAIIDYRQKNGAFTTVDQLEKVSGIGPKTVDKIRSQITI